MYQLLLHKPSFVMHAIISQSIMHDLEIHKALRTEKAFTMYLETKPNQTWTRVVEKPDLIWYNPIYNVYLISRNIHTLDFKIMNVSHYRMPPPNSQGCSKIYCLQPESQRGDRDPDHAAGRSCAAVPELASTCRPWTPLKQAQTWEGGKTSEHSQTQIWKLSAPAKGIF